MCRGVDLVLKVRISFACDLRAEPYHTCVQHIRVSDTFVSGIRDSASMLAMGKLQRERVGLLLLGLVKDLMKILAMFAGGVCLCILQHPAAGASRWSGGL
jgi:hypothetical protein